VGLFQAFIQFDIEDLVAQGLRARISFKFCATLVPY